jgi:hypothetical protein
VKLLTNTALHELLMNAWREGRASIKSECPTGAKALQPHWHCSGCGCCFFNASEVARWDQPVCNGGSDPWCARCVAASLRRGTYLSVGRLYDHDGKVVDPQQMPITKQRSKRTK